MADNALFQPGTARLAHDDTYLAALREQAAETRTLLSNRQKPERKFALKRRGAHPLSARRGATERFCAILAAAMSACYSRSR
jgi:hypothetical protein